MRPNWMIQTALTIVTIATLGGTAAAGPFVPPLAAATTQNMTSEIQYRTYPRYGHGLRYYAPRYAAPRYYAPRYYAAPRHYPRSYGYRPFVGFSAGVIAGAIIANSIYAPRRGYYYDTYDYSGPYYYPADYRGDPRIICARHFRSFEWDTGLYTTYRGEKRMCPYLGV